MVLRWSEASEALRRGREDVDGIHVVSKMILFTVRESFIGFTRTHKSHSVPISSSALYGESLEPYQYDFSSVSI